jgi:hypothetical protein
VGKLDVDDVEALELTRSLKPTLVFGPCISFDPRDVIIHSKCDNRWN